MRCRATMLAVLLQCQTLTAAAPDQPMNQQHAGSRDNQRKTAKPKVQLPCGHRRHFHNVTSAYSRFIKTELPKGVHQIRHAALFPEALP
jgi:hypothetical protein